MRKHRRQNVLQLYPGHALRQHRSEFDKWIFCSICALKTSPATIGLSPFLTASGVWILVSRHFTEFTPQNQPDMQVFGALKTFRGLLAGFVYQPVYYFFIFIPLILSDVLAYNIVCQVLTILFTQKGVGCYFFLHADESFFVDELISCLYFFFYQIN